MPNLTLVVLAVLTIIAFVNGSNNMDYGPCELRVLKQEVCAGPKQKSCATVRVKEKVIGHLIHEEVNVTEDVSPEMAKIQAFAVSSQKQNNELIRYRMNKPCESDVFRPVLNNIFNLTKACVIKKGFYPVTLNVTQIQEDYYGGKFFYGNWSFRSAFFSKKCNLFCTITYVTVFPKKSL